MLWSTSTLLAEELPAKSTAFESILNSDFTVGLQIKVRIYESVDKPSVHLCENGFIKPNSSSMGQFRWTVPFGVPNIND